MPLIFLIFLSMNPFNKQLIDFPRKKCLLNQNLSIPLCLRAPLLKEIKHQLDTLWNPFSSDVCHSTLFLSWRTPGELTLFCYIENIHIQSHSLIGQSQYMSHFTSLCVSSGSRNSIWLPWGWLKALSLRHELKTSRGFLISVERRTINQALHRLTCSIDTMTTRCSLLPSCLEILTKSTECVLICCSLQSPTFSFCLSDYSGFCGGPF